VTSAILNIARARSIDTRATRFGRCFTAMKLPYYFDFDGLVLPMILHPGPHRKGKETDLVWLSESSVQ